MNVRVPTRPCRDPHIHYGVVTSLEQRSRIAACTDSDQLKRWAARAGRVRTCEELFAEDRTVTVEAGCRGRDIALPCGS
jgi:hypothetical protein